MNKIKHSSKIHFLYSVVEMVLEYLCFAMLDL